MGSKDDAKVYDYRASVDYALCEGPIDALNYVWIKDKRVFCGQVTSRRDLCINRPDLFGGDTKEGGVDGVIECYMGTENDVSSPSLGRRKGFDFSGVIDETTSDEDRAKHFSKAPVAPGIAHMFFRRSGYEAGGFRWITNSYYLPAMKASVTRLPRGLDTKWSSIRPLTAIYADGSVPDLQDPDQYLGRLVKSGPNAVSWVGVAVPPRQFNNIGYGVFSIYKYLTEPDQRLPIDDEVGACDVAYTSTGVDLMAGLRPLFNGIPMAHPEVPAVAIDAGGAYIEISSFTEVVSIGFFGAGQYGTHTQYELAMWAETIDPDTGDKIPGRYLGRSQSFRNTQSNIVQLNILPGTRYIALGTSAGAQWIYNRVRYELNYCNLIYPLTEMVHCTMDDNLGELPDANPAHDAYELLLDEIGRDNNDMEQFIDKPSFLACAETLFKEGMGISYKTDQDIDRKSLLQQIADHIRCAFFQSPSTGKWTMKLLRDDYVFANLPILTMDDCEIVNGKRRAWSQCVSEIVVEYTDPQEEGNATVTAFNDASGAIINGRVTKTNSYPFFRNAAIAQKVAERDVTEESYPLWQGTLRVSRKLWQITPGSVYRLQYMDADHQIADMAIRILTVDYGDTSDQGITVEVVEDIFAVAKTQYREPQLPTREPSLPILAVAPEHMMVMSFNYPQLVRKGLTDDFGDDDHPAQILTVLAHSFTTRLDGIYVVRRRTDLRTPSRSGVQESIGFIKQTNAVPLSTALGWQVYSDIPRADIERVTEGDIVAGRFYVITDPVARPTEFNSEIIELVEYNASSRTWRVKRGVFDTVPRAWAVNSILWDLETALSSRFKTEIFDPLAFEVRYFGLTLSGPQVTSEFAAYELFDPETARSFRPHRPGNVKINGVGPEAFIDTDENSDIEEFEITWSSRNRFYEDYSVPAWDEGDQLPEDGVRYLVRIRHPTDPNRILHQQVVDGLSVILPISVLAPRGAGSVEVWAMRPIEGEELPDPLPENPAWEDYYTLSLMGSKNYIQIDKVALDYQGWNFLWGRDWSGTGAA